jgi:hypothetical protein
MDQWNVIKMYAQQKPALPLTLTELLMCLIPLHSSFHTKDATLLILMIRLMNAITL